MTIQRRCTFTAWRLLLLGWSVVNAQNTTEPSAVPSMMPTLFPSLMPSLDTAEPTGAPNTTAPTSEPTMLTTTLMPTSSPTNATTEAPTDLPTGIPTVFIAVNTSVPTVSPTASPNITTAVPTTAPTNVTVVMPTDTPTMMPTELNLTETPTVDPNATEAPTESPNVTEAPTDAPTMMPTLAPTAEMTDMPTSTTGMPTSSPSGSPTQSPVSIGTRVEQSYTGLRMTLNGVGSLDAAAQSLFMSTVSSFYNGLYSGRRLRRGLRSLQKVDGVSDFTTQISYVSEDVTTTGNTITYDQEISYLSTTTASPDAVISQPFQDPDISADFVDQLRSSGNAFSGLTGVSPPTIPREEPLEDDDDDGLSGGAIAGIVIGAVACVAICAFAVMRGGGGGDGHARLPASGSEPPASFSAMQSEDVSTMDDANIRRVGTNETGSLLDVGDQSVATVDYDYSKAYGGADNSVVSSAGGTMGENTRETGSALQPSARAALGASFDSEGKPDANVREEVIEINAPAGKLGVVIDTPDEGAPVVHAVKDSSVIADLIQVGDKLVAVDDEDVTAMTAIKVSKLISKKSANPSRKLTVIRQVVVED